MHDATLFLTHEEARDPEVSSQLDGDYPAVDAEGAHYLDGHTIYYGTAADLIEERREDVAVDDTEISTGRAKVLVPRAIDFYVDVSTDPGFIGISSASAGEWFVKRVAAQTGVNVMQTRIDVDAFAEHIRDQETADAWNVSHSRDYGGGKEKTSIEYHDAADLASASNGTIGLGFEYFWDDIAMRGVIYESGYVANYRDGLLEEVFAKWVREEVLPFLEIEHDEEETTEQTELTEDEQDRAEVAVTDGGSDE
ncbi:hypothetical protein C461_03282 [Halorubrum aidingense JCM 13560]|uniref:Uncharacterized protein n=1 Tax=Halorubrum aidingense JCM 13560 TaxID=1230454 RepID=M0PK91_9EURY|nr:hypothetical protein [Halorubrum aidingense]EMA69165.1 hypothetical protein C461_03282 [Halorubrum aidingense JCM 13560]